MNTIASDPNLAIVQDILMEQLELPREQVVPEARIEEDLGADSLDKVEIGMRAEERFDIMIPDENLEGVQTVGDFLEVVLKLKSPPTQRS